MLFLKFNYFLSYSNFFNVLKIEAYEAFILFSFTFPM